MLDLQNRKIDYLRVSVTDRCNLRCVYCMPEAGVTPVAHGEILTYEEIIRICECASHLGVRKIKLTGGEPLVRRGLPALVHALKELPLIEQVTLTTNGVLLCDFIDELADAGLDAVNISLDTLDEQRYEAITRRPGLNRALMAISRALEKNITVKINIVPVRELNGGSLSALALLAKDKPIDVRFIELMPIGCGRQLTPIDGEEIKAELTQAFGSLTPFDGTRGNGPAVYYSLNGFAGKIGFISAVSHEFCESCNRVRLTSTGFLKLCLNHNMGIDLKMPLRAGVDNEQLTRLMENAIQNKPVRHAFGGQSADTETKGMSQIGG
jgi:cyclic pyranopterin phosphate synthase